MQEPVIPSNEALRIAALRSLNILDTPPEERFDRITRLAQRVFDVPIALVSLIDTNRQWFKSCQGLDASETPRSISFCGHAILHNVPLVIPDATKDLRFADNPLVTSPPDIRFYAGQPLKAADGSRIGTLCIIDRKPHFLTPSDLDSLLDLAIMVENELNTVDFNKAATIVRNSEIRLHTILNNIADAIITIDTGGVIESVNQAGQNIFGYSSIELVGKNLNILLPEPYYSQHAGYIKHYLNTGEARVFGNEREAEGKRKNGDIFPIEISVSEMWIESRRLFTGIIRDTTERKKIERLKGEFVSMVSHELRTPLTSILGSLGLVSAGVTGNLPDQSKNMVDIAYKNSERLLKLINDILDIDKIESGKMRFDLQPLEIMPLIQQSLESNAGYGKQYNVNFLVTHGLPEAKVTVEADRFIQVMSNLMSNAAKFSPEGATVEINVQRHVKNLRVSVRDYGSGIPDSFKEKVFQQFSQADSSDSRQKGGTGLGLSICKAMIEKMGGEIAFENQEGGGTLFYFDLPEVILL